MKLYAIAVTVNNKPKHTILHATPKKKSVRASPMTSLFSHPNLEGKNLLLYFTYLYFQKYFFNVLYFFDDPMNFFFFQLNGEKGHS